MLVTYSCDGEILDFKTGRTRREGILHTYSPPKGQGTKLPCGARLFGRLYFNPPIPRLDLHGKNVRIQRKPGRENQRENNRNSPKKTIKNPENDRAPLSGFDEFMSYFKKWEKPYVNDSLFIPFHPTSLTYLFGMLLPSFRTPSIADVGHATSNGHPPIHRKQETLFLFSSPKVA